MHVYLIPGMGCTERLFDGIDLSADMVRVAGERGLYQELLVGDITLPIDRDDASYDAVISTGTFTHGHVGSEPLAEMISILKPGGILACTVHQDLWTSLGFEKAFKQFESDGVIERLVFELDQYFEANDPEGWFCIYRKF